MSICPHTAIVPAPPPEVIDLSADSDDDEVNPYPSIILTPSPEAFDLTWDDDPVIWSPEYQWMGADAYMLVVGFTNSVMRNSPEFAWILFKLSKEEARREAIDRLAWMVVAAETLLNLKELDRVENRQDYITDIDFTESNRLMEKYRAGLAPADVSLLDAMVADPRLIEVARMALSVYDPSTIPNLGSEVNSTILDAAATDASNDAQPSTATEAVDTAQLDEPPANPAAANVQATGTPGLRSASALGPDLVLRELNGEGTRATCRKKPNGHFNARSVGLPLITQISVEGPVGTTLRRLEGLLTRQIIRLAFERVGCRLIAVPIFATYSAANAVIGSKSEPAASQPSSTLQAGPSPAATSTSSLLAVNENHSGDASSSAGPSTSTAQQPRGQAGRPRRTRNQQRGTSSAASSSGQQTRAQAGNKKPRIYDDQMNSFRLNRDICFDFPPASED
ncbi:hypothetical protein EST38_g5814 [Candolleomyces aberdarensis]|uniref:Uncharacterized protein n=1 Tax=Candolleomyces aberdarensis TaxID=2316362 RepID=A0A4Q2DJM2_9AGAR|nr:hypothetical protein EST38_g5814 [Candolleomyces aberdarensis]